ncbi:protein kinase domain-containing protein [Endozoicomonas arenosclerae]|uniref:protein kinase domain-containing protein n=1 Tax=Endozoicomonas arenosclerae TaxID=1633495 RepID=UPI00078583F3|nr:protein kinase [Endozoicomonas arenosclerae]
MAYSSGLSTQPTGSNPQQPYSTSEKGAVAAGTFLGMAVGALMQEGRGSVMGGALGYLVSNQAIGLYKAFTVKGSPLYLKKSWAEPVSANDPRESMTKLLDMPEQQGVELGQGNFSRVQKFTCREGEPFVIKWIKDAEPGQSSDMLADREKWFGLEKGEINGLQLNQHPNLVKTYALLVQDTGSGQYSLINHPEQVSPESRSQYKVKAVINECIDGVELKVASTGVPELGIEPVPDILFMPEMAIKLGLPVCEALEYLHANGVVYRDLKPENIMIRRGDREVKLVDLGFSKQLQPGEKTFSFCGTPEFVAPEVIIGEHSHSFESDAWSLGIVLLEMATGKTPDQFSMETGDLVEQPGNNFETYQRVLDFGGASGEEKKRFIRKHFAQRFFEHDKLLDIIVGLTEFDPEKRMKISEACEQLKVLRQKLKTQERVDWVFSKLRLI